jgi:uncharacterized membrane protein YbhN (UPF0104 family)
MTRRRRAAHVRRGLWSIGAALVMLLALYLIAPRVAGLEQTWQRIRAGSPIWLIAAIVLEGGSFAGYTWLLRVVGSDGPATVSWRRALAITLGGVAATRIVTVAGAGGIALTIAGLRASGHSTRSAAERQAVDLVALYGLFFALMLACGLLLGASGSSSSALTLFPATVAALIISVALAVARVPATAERALRRRLGPRGSGLAAVPSVLAAGVRGAGALARRREPALLGGVAWWVFDIAAFWACLRAFGGSVPVTKLTMAYLVGHAFNVLPVPGGVGPVEGGMIGALAAFGEPAGLALVGVLAYQAVSVWVPALPGAVALGYLRRATRDARDGT